MNRGWLVRAGSGPEDFLRRHSLEGRFRSELARMEAARRIGEVKGLFRVPATSDVDPRTLTFRVERIRGFRSLSDLMADPVQAGPLLRRASTVLGTIHSATYDSPDGEREPLFHGDYDLHNVGLDESDRLVLLDWDGAPGLENTGLSVQDRDLGILQFSLVANALRLGHPPHWIARRVEAVHLSYREQVPLADGLHTSGLIVFRALTKWGNVPGDTWAVRLRRWVIRRTGYIVYSGLASGGLTERGVEK